MRKDKAKSDKAELADITQAMAYRQSLMKYAEKYGVSRAGRK